jgi:hypothetical protein
VNSDVANSPAAMHAMPSVGMPTPRLPSRPRGTIGSGARHSIHTKAASNTPLSTSNVAISGESQARPFPPSESVAKSGPMPATSNAAPR